MSSKVSALLRFDFLSQKTNENRDFSNELPRKGVDVSGDNKHLQLSKDLIGGSNVVVPSQQFTLERK